MVERYEPLAPDPENQVLPAQLTLVGWRATCNSYRVLTPAETLRRRSMFVASTIEESAVRRLCEVVTHPVVR
jgi:hypothetical protein